MSNQDKLGSILVPVDFSEQSEVALEQAVSLSRVFNSEIHVLNVINEDFSLSQLFDDNDKIQYQKRAEARLDEFVKVKNAEFGIELKSMQVTGKIYNQIVNSADVIDAEFIVMGTAGSTTLKKRFIGSNALRVVRESHKPVITIKGKHHRKGCQNIVLPLDLTKETKEKVAKAVEFAKRFGSIIRVVSVLRTNDEFIVNRLTRQLDQVKKYVVEQGVECGAEIIRDTKGEHTLAESIIDYANRIKGDLIMLMTQQELDFTDYFIGSSAQGVINNSDIPVLSIVPAPKKDTTSFRPY
ncbi:MAG: nucleotide-binding universal stress UspA family protein [Bacteroidia bacterium]|jgi:nucleotide-binding universal stress UspA family protein